MEWPEWHITISCFVEEPCSYSFPAISKQNYCSIGYLCLWPRNRRVGHTCDAIHVVEPPRVHGPGCLGAHGQLDEMSKDIKWTQHQNLYRPKAKGVLPQHSHTFVDALEGLVPPNSLPPLSFDSETFDPQACITLLTTA